ncbi:cell division protein FtsQ/DivIB [Candidatus Gromoviella agglomerans]|uniref:cell division protein FtsQ/DivIB n=1 Tax=Candidatus Gromoviella agglomerans TaxID=2806609 RepID=UPI001E33EED5|nr:hypothetical protein [Candidatus Gromoviella agglomerans]
MQSLRKIARLLKIFRIIALFLIIGLIIYCPFNSYLRSSLDLFLTSKGIIIHDVEISDDIFIKKDYILNIVKQHATIGNEERNGIPKSTVFADIYAIHRNLWHLGVFEYLIVKKVFPHKLLIHVKQKKIIAIITSINKQEQSQITILFDDGIIQKFPISMINESVLKNVLMIFSPSLNDEFLNAIAKDIKNINIIRANMKEYHFDLEFLPSYRWNVNITGNLDNNRLSQSKITLKMPRENIKNAFEIFEKYRDKIISSSVVDFRFIKSEYILMKAAKIER